ncbi:Rieske 2Fe-2S domain-containing protein [Streptomyces sp. NPDC001663]|uniref:Rieske 2Fe-2S domain-containing protein n=1 Tax=Streptomyces sp. NPDC001663 TaxID=3364597 RepID=UPI0036B55ED6
MVRLGSRQYAVHRNESGSLQAASARCTHLGCIVSFNHTEQARECPCHGWLHPGRAGPPGCRRTSAGKARHRGIGATGSGCNIHLSVKRDN